MTTTPTTFAEINADPALDDLIDSRFAVTGTHGRGFAVRKVMETLSPQDRIVSTDPVASFDTEAETVAFLVNAVRPAPAPEFTIRDNGDGTATVLDGGIAVMTVERQRGSYEPDRGFGGGYVSLAYVARGHELVGKANPGEYDSPRFRVGVASSSVEVVSNVNRDTVIEAMAAARPLYVAGRMADVREAHANGHLSEDFAAQVAEWGPKWRENGEADLADAMEAFVAEVLS